jgi:hypothetical protein
VALVLGVIAAAVGGFVGVKNLREDYFRNENMVIEREAAIGRGEF